MLNKELHLLIMGRILRDIYSDISLAPILAFKGGTSAYLFYGLPRFSVDLDFDLISPDKSAPELVFKKIVKILKKYGKVKDKCMKFFTVLTELSYGEADHNIKVEINLRRLKIPPAEMYELKDYLGISMLVCRKEYLFAGKLAALTGRKVMAMRDVYDINFFARNNWDVHKFALYEMTKKSLKEQLLDSFELIEKIPENQVLQGLGEVVAPKEKLWIKRELKTDTVFLLKNYLAAQGS